MTAAQKMVCRKIALRSVDKLLDLKVSEENAHCEIDLTLQPKQSPLGDAARSKIRYIAGCCVSKVWKRLQGMVVAKLHESKEKVEVMRIFVKQKLIGKLEISEADLFKFN